MAKSLCRNRHTVQKLFALKSQLQGVSLRMVSLQSTEAMAQSMRGATQAMRVMNGRMNLPGMQKVLMEFDRQNERMDMTSEMMGGAIDDALGEEEEEEEADELVSQLLDELGIATDTALVSAPKEKQQQQQQQQAAVEPQAPVMMAEGGGGGGGAGGGGGMPAGGAGGGGGGALDEDLAARLDALRRL
jgi:charged multivesicular body protein 2A